LGGRGVGGIGGWEGSGGEVGASREAGKWRRKTRDRTCRAEVEADEGGGVME